MHINALDSKFTGRFNGKHAQLHSLCIREELPYSINSSTCTQTHMDRCTGDVRRRRCFVLIAHMLVCCLLSVKCFPLETWAQQCTLAIGFIHACLSDNIISLQITHNNVIKYHGTIIVFFAYSNVTDSLIELHSWQHWSYSWRENSKLNGGVTHMNKQGLWERCIFYNLYMHPRWKQVVEHEY